VTAVAEAIEKENQEDVFLVPTLWLGTSHEHVEFAGTLSLDVGTYTKLLTSLIESLIKHRFYKFFILGSHSANQAIHSVVLRELKVKHRNGQFVASSWCDGLEDCFVKHLTGPLKSLGHACEIETSLMLHLRPEQVHMDQASNEGLQPKPVIRNLISSFEEITEEGVWGHPLFATAEKGRLLFERAVGNLTQQIRALREGFVLTPPHV
jgi:creatinine amidohydrolase